MGATDESQTYGWGMLEGERKERERNRPHRERLDAARELLQRWLAGEVGPAIQEDTAKLLGPERPVMAPVKRTYGSVLRRYTESIQPPWYGNCRTRSDDERTITIVVNDLKCAPDVRQLWNKAEQIVDASKDCAI